MAFNKSMSSVAAGANHIAEIIKEREKAGIPMQNNSKPAPVKQNEFYQALVKNKTALQSYQSVKSSKEDLAKGFSS